MIWYDLKNLINRFALSRYLPSFELNSGESSTDSSHLVLRNWFVSEIHLGNIQNQFGRWTFRTVPVFQLRVARCFSQQIESGKYENEMIMICWKRNIFITHFETFFSVELCNCVIFTESYSTSPAKCRTVKCSMCDFLSRTFDCAQCLCIFSLKFSIDGLINFDSSSSNLSMPVSQFPTKSSKKKCIK